MKTKITFLGVLLISFISNAQTIYKSSIDSGGASSTNGNIQVLYTIGEVNVQELSTGNIAVSEGFVSKAFEVIIDPKVFLQGPLINPATAGLMNDDLRFLGYLPTTSPYADAATVVATVFDEGGTLGSGATQDDIVDWVWVEIRAANDNTNLINGKSALLQRDGDIVTLDGVSKLIMTAAPTSYYIIVSHRNHLGAMSLATIGLNEATATVVNFKSNGFSSYGSNAQVQLGTGDMALRAGDTNSGNQIKFSGSVNNANVIKDYVLADPSNGFNSVTFPSTGYILIDVDMNGNGKFSGSNNDSNIIKDNVLAHPSNSFNSSTYTIAPTVPEN